MSHEELVVIFPLKTTTVPPYTTTNAVFYGRDNFLLIDPGSKKPDQQELISNYLNERIAAGQKFHGIYLTHHHGDHTRAAQVLAQRFSVPIFAHKNALPLLNFLAKPLGDDPIFLEKDLSLIPLHTPGHSTDHVAFYDGHGLLIAGDMITDRGTVLIPPGDGGLKIYLASLDALCKLFLTQIIPAHGNPITHEPRQFLLKALRHRYQRIKAVLDALACSDQDLDGTEITLRVYGESLPENLMVFAQLSVESSLEWLLEMDLVKNPNHKWRAMGKESLLISGPIEEIDEGLRNS